MSPDEIKELLELKGWNQAELARRMDTTEASVSRWLLPASDPRSRSPLGPARVLLREWLERARRHPQPV
ncbi:MAG TPA: helix-turn-helix domain-containing protein [Gemmataceae bacterium]|nr:helix-turn-helix domain-containing protein [Gemmataceae bacterium]